MAARDPDARADRILAEHDAAAGARLAAPAAALHPRDSDPVAHRAAVDAGTERHDLAHGLVPEGARELDPRERTLGQVDVRVAETARTDLDEDLVGSGRRSRDVPELPAAMKRRRDGCTHEVSPLLVNRERTKANEYSPRSSSRSPRLSPRPRGG